MTEPQSVADDTQVVSEDQGQTPAPQAKPAPSQEQATHAPQSIDELPSWVQKEIKNLRTENAKARKERQQREDKESSALELEQKRREQAQEELTGVRTELQRFRFAESIQLPNKQYAWLAAQQYGIEIEFDDANRPTNADKVAKELAKRDPQLFGAGKADAGERGTESVNGDTPAHTLLGMLDQRR